MNEVERAHARVHEQAMTDPRTRVPMLLRPVQACAADVVWKRADLDEAIADLHAAIVEAVAAGVSGTEVAQAAGVTRQRVSQIAPGAKGVRARARARKKAPALVRVNDPATVPELPTVVPPHHALSGVVSLRDRSRYGRPTGMLYGSELLGAVLEYARTKGWERVYLTGPAPFMADTTATQAEAVRAWALQEFRGWTAGAHYLADPLLPVLRFTHADGHRVTVLRAASWWGETDADLPTCQTAWHNLERLVDAVPAFRGAGLADTPATAGRALWLRTIPEGKGYAVLSAELRELIATTSGQGRIQLMPNPWAPSNRADDKVADFTYLDGRFMYAALTWGMPVGEPARWTGADLDALPAEESERLIRGRSRWRLTATVPDGWDHVGLLPCKADDGGTWLYPDQAGQVFTTWADGSEVWLAICHGWGVELHEGLVWTEGKPLNVWRDALVMCWESANAGAQQGHESAALAARAIRSLVLYALGAFAARSHPITRTAPVGSDPDVPGGTEVRLVGDNLVWHEVAPVSAWTERTAHPEWSATVWARARVRLVTLALRLPRDQVVGMATDALYVAGGPPDFLEDTAEKPGEFRVKGHRPGPFTWPASYADLYVLRDESESAR